MKLRFVAAPLVPLILGALVYVLWRSPSLLMFRWFDQLGLAPSIALARDTASGARQYLRNGCSIHSLMPPGCQPAS
jgi:hypothetical protein